MLHGTSYHLTAHARQRVAERAIPQPLIDLILAYGDVQEAREGAQKIALSKSSCRSIRRELGGRMAHNSDYFRRVYVVAAGDRIITAAFASKPIFH